MSIAGRNLIRLAAVGLCLALPACSGKPSAPPPGGATGSKAEKARRDAEALATDCIDGAATSQVRAAPELEVHRTLKDRVLGRAVPPKNGTPPPLPAPEPVLVKGPPAPTAPPRPGISSLVVREHVVSVLPYATEAEAEEDALAAACEVVERKLAELDPPVRHKVSPNEVRNEFLRKDSRSVRPLDAEREKAFARAGIDGPLVYVEYDVEVTSDQVRELRTQERVGAGLRFLGILTAVALAGFLFLRADEWTRGYLTSWLALGAVALAGGAAAALIFV
jgi:hypothetical protein